MLNGGVYHRLIVSTNNQKRLITETSTKESPIESYRLEHPPLTKEENEIIQARIL